MELKILDPFGDYETAGYLRNVYGVKYLAIVGHLETAAFQQEIRGTLRFLRRLPNLRYQQVTETHRRLFSSLYPWAGQDRSVTAPKIAIAKKCRTPSSRHFHIRKPMSTALELSSSSPSNPSPILSTKTV